MNKLERNNTLFSATD